ncbi:MAG: ABC transporter ATP-binding protein [Burkholderiales bacterium]|jgi:putative spermidine/putrescine transport system ATP-binding protein|nr:ABC transporter ATP-binding protein [Burkholderiales bacterium]
MSFLELEALTKRYGEHAAVDGISLRVAKGEFVSLLGPSGCGKTTTLQMIAGFVEPTAGRVTLEGRNLLAVPAARRGLGIVFQNYALFPHMTVAENVAFGLEMRKVGRTERQQRVAETLALVGLAGFAERHPVQLSGGQQQRVALARALVIQPGLLLLDEPLSNLDAKLREEMQVELRRIQRAVGITTLMVTHDQAEALALSDRVVVMHQGRIEQEDSPLAAYEHPRTGFVCDFLGKANLFKVDRVDATGLAVGSLTLPLPLGESAAVRAGDRILVRPEKIAFGEPGPAALPARVTNRVFQGNHWLVQLHTALGDALVIRQNDGSACPVEGDEVHLVWRAEAMRAVAAERPAG